MCKLYAFGTMCNIFDWICDFLRERPQRVMMRESWSKRHCQRVMVNGELSEWQSVISEVPQGSVLGHAQFLISIKYLPAE